MGGALAEGVDTVVSVGGVQSNHARLTAATCARLGLACELILARMVPRDGDDYEKNGNVLLDELFGAKPAILPRGENALDHANARAETLRAAGHNVLVLPTGGSTPLGALGYARCAREIARQEEARGSRFDRVIVPNSARERRLGWLQVTRRWEGIHARSALMPCSLPRIARGRRHATWPTRRLA